MAHSPCQTPPTLALDKRGGRVQFLPPGTKPEETKQARVPQKS